MLQPTHFLFPKLAWSKCWHQYIDHNSATRAHPWAYSPSHPGYTQPHPLTQGILTLTLSPRVYSPSPSHPGYTHPHPLTKGILTLTLSPRRILTTAGIIVLLVPVHGGYAGALELVDWVPCSILPGNHLTPKSSTWSGLIPFSHMSVLTSVSTNLRLKSRYLKGLFARHCQWALQSLALYQ